MGACLSMIAKIAAAPWPQKKTLMMAISFVFSSVTCHSLVCYIFVRQSSTDGIGATPSHPAD